MPPRTVKAVIRPGEQSGYVAECLEIPVVTPILTVPVHDELDTGTCRAILRQASRYVPEQDLRPHFYTE